MSQTSQTIFVLEDDPDINRLVGHQLERAGYGVRPYFAIGTIVEDAERARPSLFLLDVMVPEGDGMDVCRRLRTHPSLSALPIIFLTARASETDRILGLELGANDYIVKPFFIRELIARVKNQFRTQTSPARTVRAGDLELDRASCRVLLRGAEVALTATEFRLLEFLMSRPGVVFSREQLLNAVWGQDRAITDRTVDVYILRLRQKIEKDASAPRLIHSVRGFGYSFEPRNQEAALEVVA